MAFLPIYQIFNKSVLTAKKRRNLEMHLGGTLVLRIENIHGLGCMKIKKSFFFLVTESYSSFANWPRCVPVAF